MRWWKVYRENQALKGLLAHMEMDIKVLEAKLKSPSKVIEATLGRGIKWYDYNGLDNPSRLTYHSNAQLVLENEAFKNEVKHYMSDLVEEIATKAQDFAHVERLRYSINGVQCLIERLGEITSPQKDQPITKDANDL